MGNRKVKVVVDNSQGKGEGRSCQDERSGRNSHEECDYWWKIIEHIDRKGAWC